MSGISICIGLFICTNNYKRKSIRTKRNIQIVVNIVFCICALCMSVYFTTDLMYNYNLVVGLLMMLAGIILGIIYQSFNSYCTDILFTFTIGISTGFWIANTLEICFFYKNIKFFGFDTYYFSYPISIIINFLFAWQF